MELVVVLLILPALWAAVLLPDWVRRFRQSRAERTIAAFNHRMSSLQHSSTARYLYDSYHPYRDVLYGSLMAEPREVDMSYLPEDLEPEPDGRLYDDGYAADGGDPDEMDIEDSEPTAVVGAPLAGVAKFPDRRASVTAVPAVPAAAPSMRTASSASSRTALRRRRQLFFGLALGFLGSLGAVLLLGTAVAWAAHATAAVLFAGYVSLLVRHHQRVVERSSKVRDLTPSLPVGRPARRSAVVVLSGESAR